MLILTSLSLSLSHTHTHTHIYAKVCHPCLSSISSYATFHPHLFHWTQLFCHFFGLIFGDPKIGYLFNLRVAYDVIHK